MLFRSDARGLSQALQDAGLQANSNSLSFSLSQGGTSGGFSEQSRGQGGSRGDDRRSGSRAVDDVDNSSSVTARAGQRTWQLAPGRVDVRI